MAGDPLAGSGTVLDDPDVGLAVDPMETIESTAAAKLAALDSEGTDPLMRGEGTELLIGGSNEPEVNNGSTPAKADDVGTSADLSTRVDEEDGEA